MKTVDPNESDDDDDDDDDDLPSPSNLITYFSNITR
jgi:hypothetical protein